MAEIFDTRPYDESPYLVFPGANPLKVRQGSSNPPLTAFVYQKGNLFGDPLPLELAGLDIAMRLFDSNGNLVVFGPAFVVDADRALIEYDWQQFDLRETGTFTAEFVFKDIDGTTFVLPSRGRMQVIVY
jgi:hypothetical protein